MGGCATREEAHLLRQPQIPPTYVVQANPLGAYWKSVVVQEVRGAPEFRWFDGGAVMTTRPTRVQTVRMLEDRLAATKLLAPNRIDAEYHLYVDFHELRGPDIWVGSDKLTSAKLTLRLVRWRTGEVIKEQVIETSYRANWAGLTPEQVRSLLAGPAGRAKDKALEPLGGVLGGIVGYYINDALIQNFHFGELSDLEGALAVGALDGFGELINSPEDEARRISPSGQLSGFDGTKRRMAATNGLLDLIFDRFVVELGKNGSIVRKRAVSCASLNPHGGRYAVLTETEDTYGVDCPGSAYFERSQDRVFRPAF